MTDVTTLAHQAAEHWGGLAKPPRLIRDRENAVCEVHLRNGARAALRLHRPGYQSPEAIASEVLWTERLAEKGFPCPMPLRTQDGRSTVAMENNQHVSVVTWIDADPIGENGAPFAGTRTVQYAIYEQLGALIKTMHDLTDQCATDDITRPSWNADALLGESPHWGRFWQNPSLTKSEQEKLQHARKNAAQHLNDIKELGEGLIHADLLQENVLKNSDGLYVIDFDDSGTGYRAYDLGTALIQHAEDPHLTDLSEALCAGYGCSTDLMPLFVMLRSMASCGWIISRAKPDDPRQRFYAERALRCADAYLKA